MLNKIPKQVGEALDFPPDVAGKSPKITVTGRQDILIENYFEIIEFSKEEICLKTTEGELRLKGRGLILKAVLATELRIGGELISLAYQGGSDEK